MYGYTPSVLAASLRPRTRRTSPFFGDAGEIPRDLEAALPVPATSPVTSSSSTATPVSLWRQRNFLLLWGGQGISILGSMLSSVARPFLVLHLGGGAREVGLMLALTSLPYLTLSLPVGAWVDR
jgi:hypothetical protein